MLLFVLASGGCATREQRVGSVCVPAKNMPSIWPVECRRLQVSSEFGPRKDPFTHRTRYHRGVDIVVPEGTPVVATGKGRVCYADWVEGYGRIVKIDHGSGLETWYAHLKSFAVKEGKKIKRGKGVGRVGDSGRTTAPHLHYEVHWNGEAVDPRPFLPRER